MATPVSRPLYQLKAEFFKTLGHPARIRVLELLSERHSADFEPAELSRTVPPAPRSARSNGRAESSIRPERFARLVTLAGMLIESAKAITIPTLLVRGGSSELVHEAHVREFLELVPHADYIDVAEARHMVAGDSNDTFSDAVLDFVVKQEARR